MKIKALLITIIVLFLMASCQNKTQEEQNEPETHELLTVTAQDYTLETEYPASIQGNQDIKIIPRVEGHLMGVYVKEGDHVKEGQLLFRLDDATYRAAVESANANVQMMTAALNRAQLEYDGKKTLRQKGRAISMWQKPTSQQQKRRSPPPATTSAIPRYEVLPMVWWVESFTVRVTLWGLPWRTVSRWWPTTNRCASISR